MGGRYRNAEERQAIDAEAARRFLEAYTSGKTEDWDNVYRWIGEDPLHGVAFAKAEASWEVTERLREVPLQLESEEIAGPAGHVEALLARRKVAAIVIIAAIIGTLVTIGLQKYVAVDRYGTDVGENRIVQLADGSSIHLNTDTAIEVSLRDTYRSLQLLRGEARFDVSRDPSRPFTVYLGGAQFQAVGGSFNVRLRPELTELTVIEGNVTVRHAGSSPKSVGPQMGAAIRGGSVAVAYLEPDQLARRIAWQSQIVRFADSTLSQAIDEFNRYRAEPIILGNPELASLRVDGTYPIDASERFLSLLHRNVGIRAVRSDDGSVILLPREEDGSSDLVNSRSVHVDR